MVLGCAAVLSGCATAWTAADRASVHTIAVATPKVAPNAFVPARAVSGETTEMAAAAGGVAGLLLGAAIDGVAQSSFDSKYKAQIAEVRRNAPRDLADRVQTAFAAQLKKSPVLGSKVVAAGATHSFQIEIQNYGLMRVGGSTDFSPAITARFKLVSPSGKPKWAFALTVIGSSITEAPLRSQYERYAADPKLLQAHFAGTADELAARAYRNLTLAVH